VDPANVVRRGTILPERSPASRRQAGSENLII
jgi:hypothetical protein